MAVISAAKFAAKYAVSPKYLDTLLTLVKQRIGIITGARDDYITYRCIASLDELLTEKNIKINDKDINLLMFLVDFTTWRYLSIEQPTAMPEDIRYRLNNLLIEKAGSL